MSILVASGGALPAVPAVWPFLSFPHFKAASLSHHSTITVRKASLGLEEGLKMLVNVSQNVSLYICGIELLISALICSELGCGLKYVNFQLKAQVSGTSGLEFHWTGTSLLSLDEEYLINEINVCNNFSRDYRHWVEPFVPFQYILCDYLKWKDI